MSNIREILTKAVIGRGVRTFATEVKMPDSTVMVGRVLGAVATNHQVFTEKAGDQIEIYGSYDVHVWYTYDEDKKTKIVRTNVEYGDLIGLQHPLRENLLAGDVISAEEVVAPYATDVRLESNIIKVDITLEVAAEVIGETKMRVAILGPVEATNAPELAYPPQEDWLMEIDHAITPNFLDADFVEFK